MNAGRFASPVRSSRNACRLNWALASRSCTLASSFRSWSCSSLTTTVWTSWCNDVMTMK